MKTIVTLLQSNQKKHIPLDKIFNGEQWPFLTPAKDGLVQWALTEDATSVALVPSTPQKISQFGIIHYKDRNNLEAQTVEDLKIHWDTLLPTEETIDKRCRGKGKRLPVRCVRQEIQQLFCRWRSQFLYKIGWE